MTLRRQSAIEFEASRAMLAMAGVRQLAQAILSCNPGSSTAYTVATNTVRRVALIHLSAGSGDIRFNYLTTATANHIPIIPGQYFVVDAAKGDLLNFYNTTGSPVTVYFLEME